MPLVETRDFGSIEFALDAFLSFPCGLPGFENERQFVLMAPESIAPAVVFQSTVTPELSFLAIPVSEVDQNYQIGITPDDLRLLELNDDSQPEENPWLRLFAIVSAAEGGELTVNLLAPVVINMKTRTGVQAVRSDTSYSHCHPVRIHRGDMECS